MKNDGIGRRSKVHHHPRTTGTVKKPAVAEATTGTVAEAKGKRPVELEATEAVGLDAVKRLGLDARDAGGTSGAGASQIAHSLAVIDGKTSGGRLRAGIAGMLLALSLCFGGITPSHAQDTSQIVAPHTASLVVTQKTGPPTLTSTASASELPELGIDARSTVFGAQVQALKRHEVTTVDAGVQRALDQFGLAMAHALRLDAAGMAMGGPLDPSKLTDADQRALQQALTGLLSEMPVGALSPRLTELLGETLRAHGVATTGLETTRLRDLGKPGGELVKAMVHELKDERPAVFYGMAVGLAGAVGVVGYTQGTDALASLGLRPEIKAKFFNDQLVAKVRAEWGARFSDPKLTTRLEHHGTVTLGGTSWSTAAGLGVVLQGTTFKNLEASGFELSGSMSGLLNNGGTLGLSSTAVRDPKNGLERVTISGVYLQEQWTAGATVSYLAREERTIGELSVGFRPQKNVEWSLYGGIDTKGEKRAGLGLRVGF